MCTAKPTHIISDQPEEKAVEFNFDAYSKTIADLIANKRNRTPMVIGVYGPWGTGKTTLMQTVRSCLADEVYHDPKLFRRCKTVWFQAWKYAEEEQILAALIEEIFRAMKRDNFFEKFKVQIEELVTRLNPFKVLGKTLESLVGADPTEFIGELAHRRKLGFYDTFQEFFDRLIWTYTRMRPRLTADEHPDDTKGALVVFIDDLDRCPRERIVRVLETIKLFMDKEGCVFVLGADNEIIETALAQNFGPDGALRFMDKIVQVTFRLPQIPSDGFKGLIDRIAPEIRESIAPHLPVILPAIRHNPRQLKRFLNNVSLLQGLARNCKVPVEPNHLLFWNVLELVYPRLARDLTENPAGMETLAGHVRALLDKIGAGERWEPDPEMLKPVPKSWQEFVQDKRLVDLVAQFRISREQLTCLCTLSRVVMAEEAKSTEEHSRHARLGQDNMVLIKAGGFLCGDEKKPTLIETDFQIDIYPVTNAQFAQFIDAKGYAKDELWSEAGLRWRNENKIGAPDYWDDERWNQSDHPVVGVSWYEADAFARWAGKTLPTEIQWERAARGTDGRQYPWGEAFDKERCNTREAGVGQTTRVTLYPNGVSPEGCYDMAGNVWEWTSSAHEDGGYVLRGGCWGGDGDDARCANRGWFNPLVRFDDVGFRCARTK